MTRATWLTLGDAHRSVLADAARAGGPRERDCADQTVTVADAGADDAALRDERRYARLFRALVACGASRTDAEDALHDAYERALRRRKPPVELDGWLFVVAQRRLSRQRLRQRIFSPLRALKHEVLEEQTPAIVMPLVRQLPPRQRQVFVARHVLGLSNEETAHALQIAPGTVSATNHQALSALRRHLEVP